MKRIDNHILELLNSLRSQGGPVMVVSHNNPDGDAVGSAHALAMYLNASGIEAYAVLPNDYPEFLAWMTDVDQIIIFYRHPDRVKKLLSEVKAIFCVDFNDMKRTAAMEPLLIATQVSKVMIDHHPNPGQEFDLLYSNLATSSTAELIMRLIQAEGNLDIINKSIAEALYVGIMTDTGSFSFACNHASTFEAVSLLITKGLVPEPVHRKVYDTFSEDRMRLLGYCISQKLKILNDCQTAYFSLTKDELKTHKYQVGDTEGIVNFALSIQGIKVAALFTERKDHIRISFRSKGSFAVNQIAGMHYEGGGHRNAAGGNSYIPMDETIKAFEETIHLYKDEILAADED